MEHLKILVNQLTALIPSVGDREEVAGYEADSADVTIPRRHRVSVSDADLRALVVMLRSVPKLSELEGGIAHHSPASQGSISLDSNRSLVTGSSTYFAVGRLRGSSDGSYRQEPEPATGDRSHLGISPRVKQHLANSRIELLKAIREVIDERIEHLSTPAQQGTKIRVE